VNKVQVSGFLPSTRQANTVVGRQYQQARETEPMEQEVAVVVILYELRRRGTRPTGTRPSKEDDGDKHDGESMRNTAGPRDGQTVSTKQALIAELAQHSPGVGLDNIHPFMDINWLIEAFHRTRKDGSPGIDGVTWAVYEENLYANLKTLLVRVKSGTYRAPPVKRAFIPKGNGEDRPIGIPTLEDKVLQRAVVMALEPIVEQEFLDCSFGFRPGKSAHQALELIWRKTMDSGRTCWVIDIDIRKFFDTLDHGKLREMLSKRVCDGVITRLIGKWLSAGVMEDGVWHDVEQGTPQGGVISPLLANMYLHDVLDVWLAQVVPPYLKGRIQLVRYADDAVIICDRREDADMLMKVLPKRLGKYGLTLHPEKTRLVRFQQPVRADGKDLMGQPPETFDFLGFTHYCGLSRKGRWAVFRKTAAGRFARAVTKVGDWCKKFRCLSVREQHRALAAKIRGHYAYYGISGNFRALSSFVREVRKTWKRWLNRRGNDATFTYKKLNALLDRLPLPSPRIVHSNV
jgi:RNA-directed DNA polymerase